MKTINIGSVPLLFSRKLAVNLFIAWLLLMSTLTDLMAAPRPPCVPLPENGLIYSERFDESYLLPADQIDPNVFIESWSGYALNRPTVQQSRPGSCRC
ncbi:MAG: hypothetical protein C5B50_19230 [Verrucomicrobia bacterium]|nr:MAG: hypothetical protein C5B50_19230 [Verrucomicrobiota bacterium]